MLDQRGVKLPELLVAATAETEGLTVLHHDAGFDRLSELTRRPTEWIRALVPLRWPVGRGGSVVRP